METEIGDPAVLLGRLAVVLAGPAPLPVALDLIVTGLQLRSAVLRGAGGALGPLLAVAGEVVHAVPTMRSQAEHPGGPSIELPVTAGGGGESATLTVVGARPSQLPALRGAAAVLGLALFGAHAAPAALAARAEALLLEADEEGDSLADALHDGPVQVLVAARYACDAAVRGGDPGLARDAVQEALVALRRSLWHLRARGAEDLPAALSALSGRRVEAGAPPLELVLDAATAARTSPSARATAYRLVQALVRDGGGPVRIVLRASGDDAVLEIEGGNPLPGPDRWQRRLRAVGGELSAHGGRLRVALPVQGPPARPPALRPVPAPPAALTRFPGRSPGPGRLPVPSASRTADQPRSPEPKACS